MRTVYDALQRPTHLYMQATGAAEILVERLVYGEGHPEALRRNLKGKPFQHYDGAGVVSNWEFDFKGNLLRGSRQLAQDYKQLVDWMVLAELTEIPQLVQAAIALLEPKTFDSSTSFDGMNRPTMMTMPDRSIIYPIHNEANLLEKVEVQLRGAVARTVFVKDINYDAKGQRQSIEYGSGVKTAYSYDRDTFRLTQLLTTRQDANVSTRLQDLNYTYDPVGNITTIQDAAQQTVYFNGEVVSPSTQYEYDALYRLIKAEGREHIGQTTSQPPETNPGLKPAYDSNDWKRRNLAHRNQGEAMRNYSEAYEYDAVGNILAVIHQAGDVGSWRRDYNYAATNNRLLSTTVPGLPNVGQSLVNYDYDTHGNMIKMPHLPLMRWDFKDQLQATSQQVRSDGGTPEITYYVYDASGQRVRKVTEKQAAAGSIPKRMNERIYLGGFEVYREYSNSDSVMLERETLHIMDDQQRIALVETKTVTNPDDESPTQLIRFQFGNHLGSASLELDDKGNVISYEEYYPYGSTAYHAVDKRIKAAGKRYRYTGMERDDETGLSYHSARYYVPWLGRWVSCDPAGMRDSSNLYEYVGSSPVSFGDATGTERKQLWLAESKAFQINPVATRTGRGITPLQAKALRGINDGFGPGTKMDWGHPANQTHGTTPAGQAPPLLPEPSVENQKKGGGVDKRAKARAKAEGKPVRDAKGYDPKVKRGTKFEQPAPRTFEQPMADYEASIARRVAPTNTSRATSNLTEVRGGNTNQLELPFENAPLRSTIEPPAARSSKSSSSGVGGKLFAGAAIVGAGGDVLVSLHEGRYKDAAVTTGVAGGVTFAITKAPYLAPLAIAYGTISAYDEKVQKHANAAAESVDSALGYDHPTVIGGIVAAGAATGESAFNGVIKPVGEGIGKGAAVIVTRLTSDEYTLKPWKSQLWADIFH
jgi:RHS repeat-associated protein